MLKKYILQIFVNLNKLIFHAAEYDIKLHYIDNEVLEAITTWDANTCKLLNSDHFFCACAVCTTYPVVHFYIPYF